jgi:hypothetical protein
LSAITDRCGRCRASHRSPADSEAKRRQWKAADAPLLDFIGSAPIGKTGRTLIGQRAFCCARGHDVKLVDPNKPGEGAPLELEREQTIS